MRSVARVMVGTGVGLSYGVLVGSVIFLIYLITGGSDQSAGLMIDPNAIFRALLLLAMIITGTAGAIVGLIVTVTGVTASVISRAVQAREMLLRV